MIGPTASGKTALAHRLCEEIPELLPVNLDAFQFYRGLDVGTAKPNAEERSQFHYSLLDFLDPWDRMDAETFSNLAMGTFSRLAQQKKIGLCVGGSGLYLRSLLDPLDPLPPADAELRSFLRSSAEIWGWPTLHAWLKYWDPNRANQLHPNDKTRIERALEIYLTSGQTLEEHKLLASKEDSQRNKRRLGSFVIEIRPDPLQLRPRIFGRVRDMLTEGWIEEVEKLVGVHGQNVFQWQGFLAIGYKEVAEFVMSGKSQTGPDFEALAESIAVQTCQYAKRQLTWNAKVPRQVRLASGQISEAEFLELVQDLRKWMSATVTID